MVDDGLWALIGYKPSLLNDRNNCISFSDKDIRRNTVLCMTFVELGAMEKY